MSDFARAKGRRAVAASILAVALIGAYFAASNDLQAAPQVFLIHAATLALAFWFPAMRMGSPGDVIRAWPTLLPWLIGWVLAWDLATAALIPGRELFDYWWLVYPGGVLLFVGLLMIHGAAVRRWRPPPAP